MKNIQSSQSYQNKTFKDLRIDVLNDVQLDNCKFDSLDFSDARLDTTVFEGCEFIGCNFSNMHFIESRFVDFVFTSCRMMGLDWGQIAGKMGLKLVCDSCDLSFGVFTHGKFSNSRITNSKLNEADFTDADFSNSELINCDFKEVKFFHTNLSKVDLRGAENLNLSLENNRVRGVKLDSVNSLRLISVQGIIIEDLDE